MKRCSMEKSLSRLKFFFEKLIGNGTVCALKRGENLVDYKEVMHLFYGDKNSDEWN